MVQKRVMYQIFPDRFAFSNDGTAGGGYRVPQAPRSDTGLHASLDEPVRWQPRSWEKSYSPDDFYGGTLKGIEQKLPYLKELGIGVVYLNPHSRSAVEPPLRYLGLFAPPDPILGTMEDFEHLCAEGEKRIRFILDGVYSTPARTAGTSTAAATTARMAPVRDRIRSSIRGTISVTSRMITAAGGASRICRR